MMIFVKWIERLCIGFIGFILFLSLSGLTSFARDIPPQFPPAIDSQQQQPTQPQPPATSSDSAPGLSNSQEFTAWVDKFMNDEMSNHIPGTVISIVKDGKVFFNKGYGYANVDKKIPVDADKTLFRVASLSKLFTATAAMQLSEES